MNGEQFKMLVFKSNDGSATCGTAYFVTEIRLITAAHGLADGAEVFVRLGDNNIRATPIWVSQDIENMDLAVLKIDESDKRGIPHFKKPNFRTQPLNGTEKFETWGYPKAACSGDDDVTDRTALPFSGKVFSKTTSDSVLHLVSEGGEPISPIDWGGISGAPIFVGNSIVGVISDGFRLFQGRLMAQSIPCAFACSASAELKDALGLNQETDFVEQAVAEMTSALEKDKHLHWAFSLAYAKHNNYPGLDAGAFASARDIAESLLQKLDDYKASRLANLADLWLVKFNTIKGDAGDKWPALIQKEPSSDNTSRWNTAEKLVDLVFRLFSVRVVPKESSSAGAVEHHKVMLDTPDTTVVELVCSAMDDRPPTYVKIEDEYGDLISKYQIFRAPPGGLSLNPGLSAAKVTSDLLELLMPKLEPKSTAWNRLNRLLENLIDNDDRSKRGRYFLQFNSPEQFEKCLDELSELKKRLSWLRFVVLNGAEQNDEPFVPLKEIIFRHQEVARQGNAATDLSIPNVRETQ